MLPDDGRVVSNFIVQALRGNEITLYGDGRQTRSFCYVDDLVDGLVQMMATGPAETGPVNLGNPSEISIRDLALLIIDLTGSVSRLAHKTLPIDDPKQRQPDISRAEALLDWRPKVSLREGLAKTIAYFESAMNDAKVSDDIGGEKPRAADGRS